MNEKAATTTPRGRGRPSKLSPDILSNIEKMLSVGTPQLLACLAVGIAEQTFYNWKLRGEEHQREGRRSEYVEFLERLSRARAKGLAASLIKIEQAASAGDWRAAAWKVERAFPEHFGRARRDSAGLGDEAVQSDTNIRFVVALPPVAASTEEWLEQVRQERAKGTLALGADYASESSGQL